jgi:hypothetical protein
VITLPGWIVNRGFATANRCGVDQVICLIGPGM